MNKEMATMRRIWREFRVELLLTLLILFGLFLLVERLNIRQTLWLWLSGAGKALVSGVTAAVAATLNFLTNRTASDLTGLALILGAVGLLAWRTRRRIIQSPSLSDKACPRCGKELHRVHRASGDRLIGFFLPMRRYLCTSTDCGWTGLRIYTTTRARRRSKRSSDAEETVGAE